MHHKRLFSTSLLLITYASMSYASSTSEIIYGRDDRVDPSFVSLNKIEKKVVSHTLALFKESNLAINDDGQYKVIAPTLGQEHNLCPGETFSEQPKASGCSGFLVAPDILLTAGHCVTTTSRCKSFKWVMGYEIDEHGQTKSIDKENVYSCKNIISRKQDTKTKEDYALIKLDRAYKDFDITGLSIRKKNTRIALGEGVAVSGHPSGLPLKLTRNGQVIKNDENIFFEANVDTFGGNSGSIVYNEATGVLEGILVRGKADYIDSSHTTIQVDQQGNEVPVTTRCQVANRVSYDQKSAEEITRITVVPELMYTSLDLQFIQSVVAGNYDQAFKLLEDGANIDTRNLDNGKTLMHYLLEDLTSMGLIKNALSYGPNLQISDYNQNRALFMILDMDNDELLDIVLGSEVDLNAQDDYGKTILHKLVEMRKYDFIQRLAGTDINLDIQDNNGNSPLLLAASYDDREIVNLLIEAGSDLNIRNNNLKNLIRFCIDNFDLETLELALGKGARPTRGILGWFFGVNDYSYVKKKLKRARSRDPINVDFFKKALGMIDKAKGTRVIF